MVMFCFYYPPPSVAFQLGYTKTVPFDQVSIVPFEEYSYLIIVSLVEE